MVVKTVPIPDTGDSVVSGALDAREPRAPSAGPRVSVVTVALPARDAAPGLGLGVACGNRTAEDGKRSRAGRRGQAGSLARGPCPPNSAVEPLNPGTGIAGCDVYMYVPGE